MAKLKINDLHYLVMEGGGARGNTYLGAIIALEKQLKKRQEENPSAVFKADVEAEYRENGLAIMDYLEVRDDQGGEIAPIIKGVAGASAGAITTLALALGLNSEEIKTVLKFDFTNFLSENDIAKYRMIGEDSGLMIGEDSPMEIKDDPYQITEKRKVKTIGGRKSKSFKYELKKNKTKVHGNLIKWAKRNAIIGFVESAIFRGFVAQIGKYIPLIRRLSERKQQRGWIADQIERALGFLGNRAGLASAALEQLLYNAGIKFLLFKALNFNAPIKLTNKAIGGVFADRGMFSGFQVREFFYDLLILAATRDTLFQRSLIKAYSGKPISTGTFKFTKANLHAPEFKLGMREETKFSREATELLTHLQNMTFLELYELTGVEYAASVANLTANTSLYYSYKTTPYFRILEAAGSSMSIPPAIRPVYNASDVFFPTGDTKSTALIEFPRKNALKGLNVMVDGSPKQFIKAGGQFMDTDYRLYEEVVKRVIQTYMLENMKESVYIDLNNDIEITTFLPVMRQLVIGDFERTNGKTERLVTKKLVNREVKMNGKIYTVSDELLAFYYNAQFKGLLLDGGYRNNIPYNYFREYIPNLKGVLAIKLDRNFPPDFLANINEKIESYLRIEAELMEKLETELFQYTLEKRSAAAVEAIKGKSNKEIAEKYERLIKFVKNEFSAYFDRQAEHISKDIEGEKNPEKARLKAEKIDRKTILKLLEQWVEIYGKGNFIKPWAKTKSILATAMEGYSYGSERGQIHSITDHNNIIALYDFGVGTYDFDLKKVRPLAKFSQNQAEIGVNDYFDGTPEDE